MKSNMKVVVNNTKKCDRKERVRILMERWLHNEYLKKLKKQQREA